MRKNVYLGNILLAAVTALAMLAAVLSRTFAPAAVLPVLNIPNLLALCVIALVLEHYLGKPNGKPCLVCAALLAIATFALLPLAAGFSKAENIWLVALLGGVIYTASKWLFGSVSQRLSSGPAGKLAAAVTGMGMILAGQAFAGMLL